MEKIYKKVGDEVWIIPVGDPPSTPFLKEEVPVIPHKNEPINQANLEKLGEMKKYLNQKLSANNLYDIIWTRK